MKKTIIIVVLILLMLMVTTILCGCESQEEENKVKVNEKVNEEWLSRLSKEEISFAVEIWNYIFSIKISNDGNYLKAKEIAIRLQIFSLAGQIKTGQAEFKDIQISPEDIEKAFRYLDMTYVIIADMNGNADGEIQQKELDDLGEKYLFQLSLFLKVRDQLIKKRV